MNGVKTGKVQITLIHKIDGPRFYQESVEDVYIVDFPVSYEDNRWNNSMQIRECMELHRSLSFAGGPTLFRRPSGVPATPSTSSEMPPRNVFGKRWRSVSTEGIRTALV